MDCCITEERQPIFSFKGSQSAAPSKRHSNKFSFKQATSPRNSTPHLEQEYLNLQRELQEVERFERTTLAQLEAEVAHYEREVADRKVELESLEATVANRLQSRDRSAV